MRDHHEENSMSKRVKIWSCGLATLALGCLVLAERGAAGDDKALRAAVAKVAAAFKKGDKAGAAKMAADFAKKFELEDIMNLYKKRDKDGLGVGSKAGVVPTGTDGIEIKLVAMGRDVPTPATLKKEGDALEEMGYDLAAIAEIAKTKPNDKAKGKKDWIEWSDEAVAGGLKLSDAAKAKAGADLKTVATKTNASCNACHSKYRK
jgi:hypothetical protein